MDREEAVKAIRAILRCIGEDPDREGLLDTPERVVKSWAEIFSGYAEDPKEILSTTFGEVGEYDEMILLKDIPFHSTCEHHMLPFIGVAHVAYIPSKNGRVVGLSKLARLVDCFGRRLQIQERLTTQIADTLMAELDARGVGVTIEASHSCMSCRGIRKDGATMVTSKLRGVFWEPEVRAEFFSLIKG